MRAKPSLFSSGLLRNLVCEGLCRSLAGCLAHHLLPGFRAHRILHGFYQVHSLFFLDLGLIGFFRGSRRGTYSPFFLGLGIIGYYKESSTFLLCLALMELYRGFR